MCSTHIPHTTPKASTGCFVSLVYCAWCGAPLCLTQHQRRQRIYAKLREAYCALCVGLHQLVLFRHIVLLVHCVLPVFRYGAPPPCIDAPPLRTVLLGPLRPPGLPLGAADRQTLRCQAKGSETDSAALTSPPLQAFSKWANLAVRGAYCVLAGFPSPGFLVLFTEVAA